MDERLPDIENNGFDLHIDLHITWIDLLIFRPEHQLFGEVINRGFQKNRIEVFIFQPIEIKPFKIVDVWAFCYGKTRSLLR